MDDEHLVQSGSADGRFRLKRQIAGRAAFAVVVLSVKECDGPLQIDADQGDSVDRWFVDSARAGIRFALGQLIHTKLYCRLNLVRITELKSLPADTTDVQIIYAAAMAMFDALGMDGTRYVTLDAERRTMNFTF